MPNHIYAPSYVSMSTALRYYGLMQETVYETQSMTIKHAIFEEYAAVGQIGDSIRTQISF